MGTINARKVHGIKRPKKTIAGLKWYSPMKGGRPSLSLRNNYTDWQGRVLWWQDAAGIHFPKLKKVKGGWVTLYNCYPDFSILINPLSREIRFCVWRFKMPNYYTCPISQWRKISRAINRGCISLKT